MSTLTIKNKIRRTHFSDGYEKGARGLVAARIDGGVGHVVDPAGKISGTLRGNHLEIGSGVVDESWRRPVHVSCLVVVERIHVQVPRTVLDPRRRNVCQKSFFFQKTVNQ